MFKIKKAIVKIDVNEYANNFSKYNGFIDCSETSRDPSEIIDIEEYETLADAEQAVDNKVYITIDDENVEISYEYIAGSEITYFKYAVYDGNEYTIDDNMYSEECFNAIKSNLEFGEKPLRKIKYPIEDDAELYVWSWFDDNG